MRFGIAAPGDKQIDLVYAKPWEVNKFKTADGSIDWV